MNATADRPVLLTGATGYVGGRLAPRLLEAGFRLRCVVRSARKLADRAWSGDPRVEIVECDLSDEPALERVMREGRAGPCFAAYYLVHSMVSAGGGYDDADRRLAEGFARCAARAGVDRIIYLGGMGETGPSLSRHLRSRREVETALASAGVPVTTLRAAMIIGSGSASFEILRYLVERLPVMVTPKWVSTESQPIAIRNVLYYLVECLRTPETVGRALDIGGPDILTYRALMRAYQVERGLRPRLVVPVPVLTPRLSSLWIHLVTPVDSRIARPLAEGLRNRVVCANDDAAKLMPQRLLGVHEAIAAALGKLERREVETVWSSAGVIPGDPDWAGGTTYVDARTVDVAAPPPRVFEAICRLGGGQGYYAVNWLWRIRGWLDKLAGGPGLRRTRRDPSSISYGDALDFWRVTEVERDRSLELRAEMKLPGVASLRFHVEPLEARGCRLTQTARFKPKGLMGILYWHAVLPLHHFVFRGMLSGIRRAAESKGEDSSGPARTQSRSSPVAAGTPADG